MNDREGMDEADRIKAEGWSAERKKSNKCKKEGNDKL